MRSWRHYEQEIKQERRRRLVIYAVVGLVVILGGWRLLKHSPKKVATVSNDDPNALVVFLQPGGGASELNHQFPATGKPEVTGKDVNLTFAKLIADALTKEGIKPVLSRTDDSFVDAVDRSQRAGQVKAKLAISLYVGSSDDLTFRGWQLIDYKIPDWDDNYRQRVAFAREMEKDLTSRLKSFSIPGHGVITRNSALPPDMPTLVLITGQLTNDTDRQLLANADYQWAIANAVTDAVVKYRDSLIDLKDPPANLQPEEISSDIFAPY